MFSIFIQYGSAVVWMQRLCSHYSIDLSVIFFWFFVRIFATSSYKQNFPCVYFSRDCCDTEMDLKIHLNILVRRAETRKQPNAAYLV